MADNTIDQAFIEEFQPHEPSRRHHKVAPGRAQGHTFASERPHVLAKSR